MKWIKFLLARPTCYNLIIIYLIKKDCFVKIIHWASTLSLLFGCIETQKNNSTLSPKEPPKISVIKKENEILMIAPLIPPHFDKNGNGRIGDVIKRVMSDCGYKLRFEMVPFGRHWKDYRDFEKYDGLATAEGKQTFKGFSTIPFHHLQDGAIVLKYSDLKNIKSITDLKGKNVIAFPNADRILGIEKHVPSFNRFSMRPDRMDQIRPLLKKRADVILADGLITAHYLSKVKIRILEGDEPDLKWSPVLYRKIFKKGPQRLFFKKKKVTEDFNKCFRKLKSSGMLEAITRPYIEMYRNVLKDQYPYF